MIRQYTFTRNISVLIKNELVSNIEDDPIVIAAL